MLIRWICVFFALSFLSLQAQAQAFSPPEWRPDGIAVVCSKIPQDPDKRGCDKDQMVGWPHQYALLVKVGPKEVPAFVHDWEEFRYFYFAPYLSLRCTSIRSKKLSNGMTINEYLRAALDPKALFHELGQNTDCIQAGRGWIRTDRLRPWTPPSPEKEILAQVTTLPNRLSKRPIHTEPPRTNMFNSRKRISLNILGEDAGAPELISKHIGECIVEPSKWRKTKPRDVSGYDKFFVPHWRKKKINARVQLPSGRVLNNQDLRAIDAISRTLYGEVQSCQFNWRKDEYKPGHFEAVGRLIVDRAEAIDSGTAYGSRDFGSSTNTPVMEQVVSRFGQFNNWDLIIKGKRKLNGALLNSLCPKNEKNKSAYVGPRETLSEEHDEIWNWAVEVASQAYLNMDSYQDHYPWKARGAPLATQKVMFYSHGRARPYSRYAMFKPLPIDGVGPYKLEFAPPYCDPFKTWQAVPRPLGKVRRENTAKASL